LLTREQGKPLEAAIQEVQIAEAFCRYFAPMEFPVEVIEGQCDLAHRDPSQAARRLSQQLRRGIFRS